MKVVVTGGAGKLGRWVVRELLDTSGGRQAHDVTVFERVPNTDLEGVRYLVGDHQELGQVVEVLSGADAVIHLSGIPRPELATDVETFRVNVLGAFNIHEAAARLGIRRVVFASSSSVLGFTYFERQFLPDYLPIDEDHPLRPQDPYALSKQVGETIARSFTEKTGMETVALRPSWLVSPEELEQIRAAGGREASKLAHFTYVDVRDAAAAFRLAAERPIAGHVALYLVADDSSVTEPLCTLYPRLCPEIGDKARSLTGSLPSFSNARAKQVLGWQPRYSWRTAAPSGEMAHAY